MTTTLEKTCEAKRNQQAPACYAKPRVNIVENNDSYVIHAEVPGVAKDGVEVTVDDGQLTILGRRSPQNGEGTPLHLETRKADFRRVFDLASDIDTDAINANVNQGVLTVRLPKSERAKPRRIEVAG